MQHLPESLSHHRVSTDDLNSVCEGEVRYSPPKSLWFLGMAGASVVGGVYFFSWSGLLVFILATGAVLLLGHSLGSHRKLIHNSYECPKWPEYVLAYMGMQVGLAGPIGLMRAHELRDYAQRLPTCHDYLRHGSAFWKDAWWQLNCELRLTNPPKIAIEPRIAEDRFYRFLEATWMWQQVPPALLLYAMGGWSFVVFGTCARVTAGVLGHWLIGYFAHNEGGMHFEVNDAAVQGRNIRLTSILTMGECWHNNHHAYPGSARLGLFAGEWDPGWWTLLLLRRVGLAWNFHLPKDLPERPELQAIDHLGGAALEPARYDLREPRFLKPRLAGYLQLLREVRSSSAMLRMEWPAGTLGRNPMRALVGDKVELIVDPTLDLLVVHAGRTSFFGLPAVCLAMGQRNLAVWLVAFILMPVAVGLESIRSAMSLRPGLN
ncbi:MAG TPA: acyl-CoA desaturase [Dongiaceae bacterium]|jgi:stearoyl-CoA desaturase (delta-9 desaturase)|nr:acyl-CoA desaturase [Dongiaceae bacterium]